MENLLIYKMRALQLYGTYLDTMQSVTSPGHINAQARNFGKQNISFVQNNRCYNVLLGKRSLKHCRALWDKAKVKVPLVLLELSFQLEREWHHMFAVF